MKEILNIRRKGTSAINQVHNKLLILQEENDRLRNSHFSIQEVERLMEENRKMRMELQQLKIDGQSDNCIRVFMPLLFYFIIAGFKGFDTTVGSGNLGFTTPIRQEIE